MQANPYAESPNTEAAPSLEEIQLHIKRMISLPKVAHAIEVYGEEKRKEIYRYADYQIETCWDEQLEGWLNSASACAYVLKADGLPIYKVGITANRAASRLATLQTGCPYKLRTFFEAPFTCMDEAAAFERLMLTTMKGSRLRGEWFEEEDEHRLWGWIGVHLRLVNDEDFMESVQNGSH